METVRPVRILSTDASDSHLYSFPSNSCIKYFGFLHFFKVFTVLPVLAEVSNGRSHSSFIFGFELSQTSW